MPFCTTCGATVSGAFCNQCGTPANAAHGQAAPTPPYAAQLVPGAAPVARRTSPIVWILIIVLGFFVLCGVGLAGFGWFAVHRARQAGVIFDRGRDGGFAIRARGQDGKTASVEFGDSASKLPSWVPEYPGSRAHASFAVKASGEGEGEGGNFTFTTPDSASRVMSFYQDKCKELGMTVNLESAVGVAGALVATDDGGDQRTLTVKILGTGRDTTVNVTYARK